jgi:hypothetical protein
LGFAIGVATVFFAPPAAADGAGAPGAGPPPAVEPAPDAGAPPADGAAASPLGAASDGGSEASCVYNLANAKTVLIQPYDNGHPPMPGPSREVFVRIGFDYPRQPGARI